MDWERRLGGLLLAWVPSKVSNEELELWRLDGTAAQRRCIRVQWETRWLETEGLCAGYWRPAMWPALSRAANDSNALDS